MLWSLWRELEHDILLQHPFQCRRTHISSLWNLIHNGDQISEAFTALVCYDTWHGDIVHLGVLVVQLHETACGVLVCEMSQGVFDDQADLGLQGHRYRALVDTDLILGFRRTLVDSGLPGHHI